MVASPRPRSAERGVALLIVLLLTLIIVPFAAEFSYQISLETMTADNVTAQLAIDNAIESQYEAVLARLRYDAPNNQYDCYDDAWNEADLRSRTDQQSEVQLETRVFDEQGKFNLRMLAQGSEAERQLWKARLIVIFEKFREGTRYDAAGYGEELAEAVYRWLNADATRGEVPKPKMIDDSPILTLDDLMLIDERFEKNQMLVDVRTGDDVAPGLHRFLTVFGTGKVSLNTAERVVLEAFFPVDPDIAQRIIERRGGSRDDQEEEEEQEQSGTEQGTGEEPSGGTEPFTDVMQVNEVEGVTANLLRANNVDLQRDFAVKSDYFLVRIAGEAANARREELYVVQRVPSSNPESGIDGFRHLLHQERTDSLEEPEGVGP